MSIQEILEKIKPFYPLFLAIVVASIFFAIGRLSHLEGQRAPIKIEYVSSTSTAAIITSGSSLSPRVTLGEKIVSTTSTTSGGEFIGSKSGKKYYFPWCGTVKRIKPENQVHFASAEEARASGFVPGGNCKGLK